MIIRLWLLLLILRRRCIIVISTRWANAKRDSYPYEVSDQTCWAPFKNTHRAFIRKAQNGFGWDWGPAYVSLRCLNES